MSVMAQDIGVQLGGRLVLSDVGLAVAPGELVAIVGANGAGKSTLLKVLAGVIPPDSGRVVLAGRSIETFDRRELGREIAYLPQDRTVHWPLAVRAVVALGRLPHGRPAATTSGADQRAIDAAMRAMDVVGLADRSVDELSGGEQARVLLARALSQEARVLVADEPTAGLDLAHALVLFSQLAALASEGRAVIVALHDLTLAARFCHRLLVLKDGRAVSSGRPKEVLSPELFSTAFGVRARLTELDGLPVVVATKPLTRG